MKKLILGFIAITALIITGCGGGGELLDAPQIIGVAADSNSVTLTWAVDTTIENHADFNGYNVYYATDDSALLLEDGEDLSPVNTTPFTVNTFTVTGLSTDTIYYFQVRTLNTSDKVGGPNDSVPVVQISPRPVFIKTVYIEWDNSDTSAVALHFSTGEVKKRSEITTTWGDMWVDHRITGDTVFFQSAFKSDTLAGFRDTRLVNAGQVGFDEMWLAPEPTLRVVEIIQEDLVFAKTVDNNYVKIHVDSVYLDTLFTSWVQITYAYQEEADYPYLVGRK